MWKLTENGDLDLSDNGTIRTLKGKASTTYQSAAVLIGTVKGSYPFYPDMGLDINTIFDARVEDGMTTEENIEKLTELMIATELEKEPNIASVLNFNFDYNYLDRNLEVSFQIVLVTGDTLFLNIGV